MTAAIAVIIGASFAGFRWLVLRSENPLAWRDSDLVRGVVSDDSVWVLSLSGRLWSVGLDSLKSVEKSVPAPVTDICASGRALFALIGEPGATRWALETRDGDAWKQSASVAGDTALGIACLPQKVLIVTTRRLITVSGSQTASMYLSKAIPAFARVSLFSWRQYLYIGLNKGEWGGALWRIDRRTRKTIAFSTGTNDDCRGAFNPDCSPITAIANDPWVHGCVVASIGLAHLDGRTGRIIQICGRRLTTLYSKPEGSRKSEPFFGMVATGDTLTAIGMDGIYTVRGPGSAGVTPVPEFSNDGNIGISLQFPHAVLAVTRAYRDLWPVT